MQPYRSLLFVPGHKESWVDKALAAGPHAVILDLEDAVPAGEKDTAREVTASSVGPPRPHEWHRRSRPSERVGHRAFWRRPPGRRPPRPDRSPVAEGLHR